MPSSRRRGKEGGIASFSFWGRQTARQASPQCVRGKPPIQIRGHSWHCGKCRGPTVREGGRSTLAVRFWLRYPHLLTRGLLQRPVCLCRRYWPLPSQIEFGSDALTTSRQTRPLTQTVLTVGFCGGRAWRIIVALGYTKIFPGILLWNEDTLRAVSRCYFYLA